MISFFLFDMKRLTIYIIIIVTFGIIPSIFQYGNFFFWSDYVVASCPHSYEIKRIISSGAPWLSWNQYLGENALANFTFGGLTSPFVWFGCLFPYSLLPYALTLSLILRFCFVGCFSLLYFRKMGVREEFAQLGALLYTFSSFVTANLQYWIFMESIMLFPLLLWSIEKIIHHEAYGGVWLCCVTFFIAFTNFYFIPCSLISAFIYGICRLYVGYHVTNRWIIVMQGMGYTILGLAMSAVVVYPTYLYLHGSPRAEVSSGVPSLVYYITFALERLRVLFMPKLWDGFIAYFLGSGWKSNAICLPVLAMCPALLYIVKNRRSWVTWLIVITLFIYLTPLNGIFSLFTNPLYTRWGYALVLFLILASLYYLQDHIISPHQLWTYITLSVTVVVGITILSIWLYRGTPFTIEEHMVMLVTSLLYIIALVLLVLYVYHPQPTLLMRSVAIYACLSLIFTIFSRTDAWYSWIGKEDFADVIKPYITENELPRNEAAFHYRTAFVTRKSNIFANMASLKNIPSIGSYGSIQNSYVLRLFATADSCANAERLGRNEFTPNIHVPSFAALMSVKDFIIYDDQYAERPQLSGLSLSSKWNGYVCYDYDHYIPMGFTYDSYIDESVIDTLLSDPKSTDIPLLLLSSLAVPKEEQCFVRPYLHRAKISDHLSLDSLCEARRQSCCTTFTGTTSGFTSSITLHNNNIVFFSVPYDPGFTATVDGTPTHIIPVNLGLMAIAVPAGHHDICFSFLPEGLLLGGGVSIASLLIVVLLGWNEHRRFSIKKRNG